MRLYEAARRKARGLFAESATVVPALLSGPRPYVLLTLLVLAIGLPGLASPPPLGAVEAGFIAATKMMLATGDFVLVRGATGEASVAPVGAHWVQAAAARLLGDSLLAYRLPSLLGGLAAVLLTFFFGRFLLGPGPALLGAAFLATAALPVMAMHQATADAVTLACVVAAQGALARFYMQPRGGRRVGLGTAFTFWLAQGCGVLAAGPVVPVVSLLTALSLSLADRATMWLRGLRPLPGLILAVAVVAPWLAAASEAAGPGTAWQLLLAPVRAATAPWPGAQTLLLPALLWPASLFALPALVRAARTRHAAAVRFNFAWLLPAWLVLEVLPGTPPGAMLVAYPALALLTALAVVAADHPLRAPSARAWYAAWGAATALAAAGAALLVPQAPWAAMAATALLVAAGVPVWLAWRGRLVPAAVVAVAAAVVAWAGGFPALPSLMPL